MTPLLVLLTGSLPTQIPSDPTRCQFRILVPEEAFVFIAGERMRSTGSERLFESPSLRPGKKYIYEISVIHEGREVVRQIKFEAGTLVEVDFRPEFQTMTNAPTPAIKPIRPQWLPGRVWRA